MFIFIAIFVSLSFSEIYQRNETVFVGGGLWGPPANWNPMTPWSAVSGTVGLVYETLFIYDPVKDDIIPWLAEEGKWLDENTYQINVRKGVQWSDGKDLTAKDVKFTFEFPGKYPSIHFVNLYKYFDKVELVDDYTVKFTFNDPRYHEWSYQLYQIPILPEHLWKDKTEEEVTAGSNEYGCIGSGAYKFETYDQDRMIFLKNENWWASKLLGINAVPKRVVYIRALSNNVVLGMIMKGEELDVANFFLPGVPAIKKAYDIHTWFEGKPYMLSDNTAFLFVNNTKKNLSNANFRIAVAYAINSPEICNRVFEDMVIPSNTLGFLPIEGWMKYYDNEVASKYGFSYDPVKAKEMLDKEGFKDIDKDGYREAPDGSKMKFDIIVPFGWTDWMESIKIIAKNLKDVGLNAEAKFPDYNRYFEQLTTGDYDFAINNFNSYVSSTPWTLYNWIFTEIIGERANNGNFERYADTSMNDLIDEFNGTPMLDVEKGKEILSQVEEKYLKEMPAIPLWYNGMWFVANNAVWTNWPAENSTNQAYPCVWGGRWQIGGLMMLTNIELK